MTGKRTLQVWLYPSENGTELDLYFDFRVKPTITTYIGHVKIPRTLSMSETAGKNESEIWELKHSIFLNKKNFTREGNYVFGVGFAGEFVDHNNDFI